jgi:hypothetical protein
MPCNHKAGNQLLNALPAAILARLQPHLEPYDLVLGNEIHVPGETDAPGAESGSSR